MSKKTGWVPTSSRLLDPTPGRSTNRPTERSNCRFPCSQNALCFFLHRLGVRQDRPRPDLCCWLDCESRPSCYYFFRAHRRRFLALAWLNIAGPGKTYWLKHLPGPSILGHLCLGTFPMFAPVRLDWGLGLWTCGDVQIHSRS